MPISPARTAAFDILLRVEKEDSYASELLHSAAYARMTPADHSLATELVMAVLRWRSLLDEQIATASTQPLAKLDVEVLVALRLAVYQFGWLDRIPRRAALHESVQLVKRAGKSSAAAFVNAVLRKLTEIPSHNSESILHEESLTVESLARLSAHPLWLVERWVKEYGLANAHQICRHNQSKPVTTIRLRTTTAETEIREAGVTLTPGNFLSSARRVLAGDVTRTAAFLNANIVIEDEASQLVAALVALRAKQGTTILDCCAAPGGKTLGIADRAVHSELIATELHTHRARLLQTRIGAARAKTIRVITGDARSLPLSGSFDQVLADVPCSGTGTLSRNPEIKWRLTPADLTDLQTRQSAILNSALTQVATGGRLIYSTCSLEREENEEVIEAVISTNKSFRWIDCRDELEQMKRNGELIWADTASLTSGPYLRTMPGIQPCDGFFAAVLQKT